jgi:hypothetical protein
VVGAKTPRKVYGRSSVALPLRRRLELLKHIGQQVSSGMATITYDPGGEPCLLQEKRFRSNFVLRSTRACALCCTEVATDGACSAGELCDRVNNPVPPEMILTNIAMPMPMFVSRLASQ